MADVVAKWKQMPAGATLHVRVYMARRLRFRLWLGTRLIRLAATLMQCDARVEHSVIGEEADGFYLHPIDRRR